MANRSNKRPDNTIQIPTLDDVYRKFGEVAEAAQLLETDLGTLLFEQEAINAGLVYDYDQAKATTIYDRVDGKTLGQLIRDLPNAVEIPFELGVRLDFALDARNELVHSFFLRHNYRRNSAEGRDIMLRELDSLHETILDAFKAVSLLTGVDLERLVAEDRGGPLPTRHLPIRTH
ncbi:MAG: hypothetical protein OXG44_12820 [Gammaproteobacteria bacterium]|nr:hypothetical protein [Gammaproteobacteria bacterium]